MTKNYWNLNMVLIWMLNSTKSINAIGQVKTPQLHIMPIKLEALAH